MKGKQHLKALISIAVVIFAIISLALKFWADGERIKIEGPSFLKVTPNNELSILVQHQLIITDSYGNTQQTVDLNAQGLSNEGDFDYFSNGDLLLYHRDYQPNVLDDLARFFRLKKISQAKPIGKDGLYRCNSLAQHCKKFTTELPAFNSSFRLLVDRKNDEVYIADTPRFILYKLDVNGTLLAKKEGGFKFPNELFLKDNKLYVANTNHHEVSVLDASTEKFAEKLESHKTTINSKHRWPSQLAFTGENWWVLIMDNAMQHGLFKVYDQNWQEVATPEVEQGADPIGLTYFKEKIYAADWENFKIYRYAYDGRRFEDFKNITLQQLASSAEHEKQRFNRISLTSLILFIVTLVMGCVAAFILEKKQTIDVLTGRNHLPEFEKPLAELEAPPGNDIYWIDNRYKNRMKWMNLFLVAIVLMFLVSYVGLWMERKTMPWQIHFIIVGMSFMVFYLFSQWKRILKVRIGVQGEYLFIDDGEGKVRSGRGTEIRYNQGAFVIADAIAMLGNPYQRLFPKEELDKWVIPRFEQGQFLGQLELFKLLWQQKNPIFMVMVNIIVMLLLMLVIVKIGH